ncbi:MAG TPA: cytochrome C [Thermoanaerobaculia bacterium]|nr:cytochrome C [Thermoanaerobaculia bacterium]
MRKTWIVALSVIGCAALFNLPEASGQNNQGNSEQSRIARGYQIAPVPLKLKGRNRELVGLGSYIVNAQGGCNDCHTNPPYAPGGDPFQGEPEQINVDGYLAGGVQFGPFTSANITPDENGLPAGKTFQEFKRLIRTGHAPERHPQLGPLLQVMPWPVFGKMVERDLKAVYEYLSASPSH